MQTANCRAGITSLLYDQYMPKIAGILAVGGGAKPAEEFQAKPVKMLWLFCRVNAQARPISGVADDNLRCG